MGTPFQDEGYTIDTKFDVLRGGGGVKMGDVVKLKRDDHSGCPLFQTLDGEREGYLIIATDIIPVVDEDAAAASSTQTFKYPCAVELKGLTLEQAINLEKAFVKLGADLYESFTSDYHVPNYNPEQWKYYGVEHDNTTGKHDTIEMYEDEGSDEVTLYTYDEVMKMAGSPASSIDDTTILEPEVYTDYQEGETLPKAITGASVYITINVNIDGNSWGITRDEAYKLYQDLQVIFEEKIV